MPAGMDLATGKSPPKMDIVFNFLCLTSSAMDSTSSAAVSGVIITQDELSNGQINRMALGEAGTTVAGDVQQAARVRPTVKVEGKDGSGVPIGLLFMSDF